MPTDIQTLKNELKHKDKEIKELKHMLAEAEAELKEYNSADNMVRPRASVLESTGLNKAIKAVFFVLLCAIIVMVGLYPWLFKDKLLGTAPQAGNDEAVNEDSFANTDTPSQPDVAVADEPLSPASESEETPRDIFTPEKKTVEVSSDLGWLNVRTQPNVETGQVIKRINSGEAYEWTEKTPENWYKIIIDDAGHTGYVSGEYVVEK